MIYPNRVCAICQKGYKRAFSRSHSVQKSVRHLKPNLQWLRLASLQRIKVCTQCLRSISKGKIKIPQNA